mmetsp:Transcript_19769/g.38722  ORF Transcript_19769/g.38722 Transcript_19769/m.38722 type:complete len:244 (-) Transcript_19769:723-1454(-)|eukprot:CAMPEP_0171499800 /NCGR_PEP_ID=MMETSP0958-20121227/8629_1 /TAXON_ID=87120 /ORGANISM="Aurantiochytrium limacinum, Strain ATCCMYA-1381" /LENGTH=243 /DNA_ID=CAMNT_0012034395 /DNA_START=431 /DNA_END=1162 /DNA_ORIENTATION=-
MSEADRQKNKGDALKSKASKSTSALAALVNEDLDDDDDDDDVDDLSHGGRLAKSTPMEPVLRGIIKVKDGKLTWNGNWAMSKELFAAKDRSKFKYTYVGDEKRLSATKPPSGRYSGYFLVKEGSSATKVVEKKVKLKFEPQDGGDGLMKVSGSGKNQFGEFSLEGRYWPEHGKLSVNKLYRSPDEDYAEEEDDDDDGAIEEEDPDEVAKELADLQADADEDIELIRKRIREQEDKVSRKKSKQ